VTRLFRVRRALWSTAVPKYMSRRLAHTQAGIPRSELARVSKNQGPPAPHVAVNVDGKDQRSQE
jgi:hypothetical protein